MFNYRAELKNRGISRFKKPHNFYQRNQDNCMRPPFPFLRRRIMPGRYPNRGYRPRNRPMFRPEFRMHRGMSSNFRYRSPSNSSSTISPDNVVRPSFHNIRPNRNIQYSCSPVNIENPSGFPIAPLNNRNVLYSCSPINGENSSRFPSTPLDRNVLYSCSPNIVENSSFSNVSHNNANILYSCSPLDIDKPPVHNALTNNRSVPYSCSPTNNVIPPFPNMPFNRNIEYSCSPVPEALLNSVENHLTVRPTDCRSTQTSDQNISDTWVEALAPTGKKYFYNSRTNLSTWEKPMNAHVIELDPTPSRKMNPGIEHTQVTHFQNQLPIVRPLVSNGSCINPVYPAPRHFILPPRFFMFPPPTIAYNAPKIYETSLSASGQDAGDKSVNVMVPSPILSFAAVTSTPISKNVTLSEPNNTPVANNVAFSAPTNTLISNYVEHSAFASTPVSINVNFNNAKVSNADSFEKTIENPPLIVTSEQLVDSKISICSENKFTDWSISDSKTSLCLPGNDNPINYFSGQINDAVEMDDNILVQCKPKESNKNATKKEEVRSVDAIPLKKQIEGDPKICESDKSRPVSSTPVPGTDWCVVWTGDEKVFFYDYQRKKSVWVRPNELLNRLDVDKLVERPILLMHENPEIPCNGFDAGAKKLKMDDIKETNQNSKESSETTSDGKIVEVEKVIPEKISLDQRIKLFCKMLQENNVSTSSIWEKELHKVVFDTRYKLIPLKEQKQVFENYVREKVKNEKNGRQKEMFLQKKNFRSLLKESNITSKTHFGDFVLRNRKDVRFTEIENIKHKEIMFYQYVSEIIMRDKDKEKLKRQKEKDFIRLLREKKVLEKHFTWSEVDKMISGDSRYKAIESKSLKEKIFQEYIDLHHQKSSSPSSIDENVSGSNKTIKRDLSEPHSKLLEQEQRSHKLAVSNFKALLNDLITCPDTHWHSAVKTLKEDSRWNMIHILKSDELEKLFNGHTDSLKKVDLWRLLDETPGISLKTSWLDIRKVVLKNSKCTKYISSERKLEAEFKEYLRQKYNTAKADFKVLLKETKIITYKSKSLLQNTNHLKDIEEALSNDKRYIFLESMRSERKVMLLAYINKLHANGPPNRSR